jgi:hypothetical protein
LIAIQVAVHYRMDETSVLASRGDPAQLKRVKLGKRTLKLSQELKRGW